MNAPEVFALKAQLAEQQERAEALEKNLAAVREASRGMTQSFFYADDKLQKIAELCNQREQAAISSLSRMHGGAPFPATVLVEEIRALLREEEGP